MSRLVVAVLFVAVTCSSVAAVDGAPQNFVGTGLGRHYGGVGLWAGHSLIDWLTIVGGIGPAGHSHVGWNVGGQLSTLAAHGNILVRGVASYGTAGRLLSSAGEFERFYETWGVGPGLGIRVLGRWWLVSDAWVGLTVPSGYERRGADIHGAVGLVFGPW